MSKLKIKIEKLFNFICSFFKEGKIKSDEDLEKEAQIIIDTRSDEKLINFSDSEIKKLIKMKIKLMYLRKNQ